MSAARHLRVRDELLAPGGSCVGLLLYESGLWEVGLAVLLVLATSSMVQRGRRRLLGLASFGLSGALVWIVLVHELAEPCGFSSSQPVSCSLQTGSSPTEFVVAATLLALVGAALVAHSRRAAHS